jgi:hypothetical protein
LRHFHELDGLVQIATLAGIDAQHQAQSRDVVLGWRVTAGRVVEDGGIQGIGDELKYLIQNALGHALVP